MRSAVPANDIHNSLQDEANPGLPKREGFWPAQSPDLLSMRGSTGAAQLTERLQPEHARVHRYVETCVVCCGQGPSRFFRYRPDGRQMVKRMLARGRPSWRHIRR